ncbi:translation initiation factor IF-2 [bacterium]|nr:translation initiation factor IF-2 [bacterium]
MTDNTENPQKKVHLIKQPKPAPGEMPAAPERPEEESLAEKKKVVVVKKKVVVMKKAPAKVVAHHDLEGGAEGGEVAQAAPVQASANPIDKAPAQGRPAAAAARPAEQSARVEAAPAQAPAPRVEAKAPEHAAAPEAPAKPARAEGPDLAAPAAASSAAPAPQPAPAAPRAADSAPGAQRPSAQDGQPAQPAASSQSGARGSYQSNPQRPYGAAGTVGGYPANRTQGDGQRGPGYQGYQGRSGYQGSGGYQGGYQGRNYQGRTPGGYQGQGGQGGQGQQGGYQGSGGYQGQGGYQGSGGYQGQGGYQGGYRNGPQQPYDPNRPRPQGGGYQGSGGYQGQGGYQGSGGYQGQGGYQGGGGYQGQGGGYQGQRPYQGSGGYQGSRPYPPSGGPGGYPRGPRPQGPGGYHPGYPGQPRPAGRAGNLAGGRPGGYGGQRGPQSGPSPLESSKGPQRKPAPRRKPGFVRKEDVELEKELQLKKKAEARAIAIPKSIDIMENISVSDLAKKMNIKPAELIGKLMGLGVMATINQKIDAETATILASEYGCEVKIVSLYDETVIEKEAENPDDLRPRPPIVTVMGHVDHGKTKLLDAIRRTDVVAHEYGGITQHIGAYQVVTPKGARITFMDTPGHAAFTKMRARGAQVTDIIVLVVSAVEGVMPQTKEAIDHAKAAQVPIIVAVNKIDLPESNPDRVKTQLSELGLIPEEWGGTTQFCEVSALQKKGIPEMLDAILLQAEILELKASYNRFAEAKIIESRIDQGRGIVATIIVEKGTLRIGDPFVAGIFPGKVRAMFDDKGKRVEEAAPSTPVEVLGFEGIPNAGDPFEVVEDEKYARAISDKRQDLKKYEEGKNVKKVTLDNLYDTISAGEMQELKVIIKGDVQGSVEALKGMLEKLSTKEIRLNVIRAAAGAISDDDVMMASASDAIIIGFNVRPIASAKSLADREKVDIRKYNIIYRAQEDIQKAMEGMLSPELKEQDVGKAEVRNIFHVPKVGIVAGCYMLEGLVHRNSQVRVIREDIEIFQGKINSLKRFKDDAREVVAGYECGIGIENCNDLKEGDMLEIYETVEVARTLGKAEENGSDKA